MKILQTTGVKKAARILGLVWIVAVIAAGFVLWAAETAVWIAPVSSNRGLIYLVFAALLPGILLVRWGSGPRAKAAPPHRRAKAPFDRAAEAGHVLRIDSDP